MIQREWHFDSLVFLLCNLVFLVILTKYLRKRHKGGRVYFDSQIQRFQSSRWGRAQWSKAVHIMVAKKQQRENA
jgi:hypothetical protein